jgi:hypothetical protein
MRSHSNLRPSGEFAVKVRRQETSNVLAFHNFTFLDTPL